MVTAFDNSYYQIILSVSDNFKIISNFSAATAESPSNGPQDARLGWGCTKDINQYAIYQMVETARVPQVN